MLVSRDLQRVYRGFRLGYLWSILEPLGMTIVLWFVFDILLGGRKLGEDPYFLFLSVAILPWWWFTKGITQSTKVFRGRSAPLTISLLPTQAAVVRVLMVSLADFVLSLPIIIVAMLFTWTFPGPWILLFPVAMLLQLLLTLLLQELLLLLALLRRGQLLTAGCRLTRLRLLPGPLLAGKKWGKRWRSSSTPSQSYRWTASSTRRNTCSRTASRERLEARAGEASGRMDGARIA